MQKKSVLIGANKVIYMLAQEILKFINKKINGVVVYLVIIGLLFFILASAILFYPEILQYVFVLVFYFLAFMILLLAVKINNIKDAINKWGKLISKKKR